MILSRPLTILWIAIPLFIQTNLIFWITYGLARVLRLKYEDAATVVGVLIEVPVTLGLVAICKRTKHWFPGPAAGKAGTNQLGM